jgi:predicted ABC-type exoprotein transport system permease subunit
MGGFSILHWLVLFIFFIPNFFIVKKAGFSPWWALLMFVPVVNLIAYWAFAFIEWPATRSPASTFE